MKDLRAAWEDEPDDAADGWDDDGELEDEELEGQDFDPEDLEELDFDHEDSDLDDDLDLEEDRDLDDDPDLDEGLGDEDEEELDDLDGGALDLDDLDDETLELDVDEGSELAGTVDVYCPYCGAQVEMIVDPLGGDLQEYVEDCEVCCQPWSVRVTLDREGIASVELGTLDEG